MAHTKEELDFYGRISLLFPQKSYISKERSQIYKERWQNSKERCLILKITFTFLQNDTTFSSRSIVPSGPPQNKDVALWHIVVHVSLLKRKTPLDQFINGLKVLNLHQLLQMHPEQMRPYPIISLFDNFDSKHHDNANERCQGFSIQAIADLDKGKFNCSPRANLCAYWWNKIPT